MKKPTATLVGTLCIVSASLLFSLGGVCIKFIPWSPLAINGARNLISSLLILAYMRLTGHRPVISGGVMLGALCLSGTTTLYVFANKLTTAANAIVLQFTSPLFILLFMWAFFRVRPCRLDLVACAVVVGGVACVFVDGLSVGGMLGNALAVASGATYAGVFMLNFFPRSDPLSSVLFGQTLSALVGLPFLCRETDFSATPLLAIAVLGVFQLALAYVLFSRGLKTVPPVTASLVSGLEPVLNPAWVALLYGEHITPTARVGGAIVIAGIVGYDLMRGRAARTHGGAAEERPPA